MNRIFIPIFTFVLGGWVGAAISKNIYAKLEKPVVQVEPEKLKGR